MSVIRPSVSYASQSISRIERLVGLVVELMAQIESALPVRVLFRGVIIGPNVELRVSGILKHDVALLIGCLEGIGPTSPALNTGAASGCTNRVLDEALFACHRGKTSCEVPKIPTIAMI